MTRGVLPAAGLAGFAALTLEILGVHILAPWFGASSLVWTNQIGVVLAAMALGGWLGGRAARGTPQPARLAGRVLVGAGFLGAIGVFLLPSFASWILPGPGMLDHADAGGVFLGGALTSSLLFFAPPVFLLAMVTPLLVEERAPGRGPGRAAGELAAVGTLGSLLGVFGTTFLGIPLLGARLTLLLTLACLVCAGAILLGRKRIAGLGLLILLPSLETDPGRTANLPHADAEVLAAAETPHGRFRVLSLPNGERWLQSHEGLDSYQSRWREGETWPGGYYDLFALAPLAAMEGDGGKGTVRFWSLGHGAGSAVGPVSAILHDRPWSGVGVELDAAVVELGNEFLPLPAVIQSKMEVIAGGDARALLRTCPGNLDFVLLDAYSRQFEIPFHLATLEFFREVHGKLREGGILALNLGTPEDGTEKDGVLVALRGTLAEAFAGHTRAHKVPLSRNWMLLARKGKALPAPTWMASHLPPGVPVGVGTSLLPSQTLGEPSYRPEVWLRDDGNPLSLAQARLWLSGK